MESLPTPISVLETYFGWELTLTNIRCWNKVSDDTWVGFAKTYLEQMKTGFTPEAIAKHVEGQKIRLYFDHYHGENYEREIVRRYAKTPLLGLSPFPTANINYGGEGLTQALAPLSKHLLVADELYLPDNFYRCFDSVADTYERHTWRNDPGIESGVRLSIAKILRWLPILAGLRDLITSGALNFLPYYVIPSFPYGISNPIVKQHIASLHVPDDPSITSVSESLGFDHPSLWKYPPKLQRPDGPREPALDCDAALNAWIDSWRLGLDPVFADKKTWQWASGIRCREETKANLTTDLMSIDILPLGKKKGLSVQDIVSMRKGEQVFGHIRDTLIGCMDKVRDNVAESASSDFVSKTCRDYIRDTLDPDERLKAIKFVDSNLAAGTVFTLAISAVFMAANPLVGLLFPLAFTPKALINAADMLNPKVRAAVRLETLL